MITHLKYIDFEFDEVTKEDIITRKGDNVSYAIPKRYVLPMFTHLSRVIKKGLHLRKRK